MSTDDGIINDIDPIFRPYVQNIYQDLKLGLCKNRVDIEKICSTAEKNDTQFRLVLPYCSKKLKWDVIFDASAPWFAPDFRFDDESFFNGINADILEEKVPSLANWNEKDPKALSNVISELVALYKRHHIHKMNEDAGSRAAFEYSALLGDGDALTSDQDVEVYVGAHVVEFLIRLNVDTSRLPELYTDGTEENPGLDTALLLVRYPNSTNAELIMSPHLTKCLGNISLPLMHQTGVLMDYVPMVTELLNDKVKGLLDHETVKRDMLTQLIVKYEGAILEHDANGAAFLFQINDFYFILQVQFGKYPDQPPILTLRSVYHIHKGRPRYKVLPECSIIDFEGNIEQEVEAFKNECTGVNTDVQSPDRDNTYELNIE